jgi:hypothetical protein
MRDSAREGERKRNRSESVDKLFLAESCLRRATAPSSCHSCKIRNVVIKNWLIIGKNTPRLADAAPDPIFVNIL